MFVPFPWFVFYSTLFSDPVSGALATAIHHSFSDDDRDRIRKSKPPEVPNVMPTPGNYGDYDYD